MSFAHPLWLAIGVVALVICVALYRRAQARRAAQAFAYSSLAFAMGAMKAPRWPPAVLFAAFVLGTAAELTALATPRLTTYVPTRDGTVMICIDTSGSMRAHDLLPSRSEAARTAARTFVDAVPDGTHVGLVTFAAGADLIATPVTDLDLIRDSLNRIPPPDGGTAIGDALTLAAQQMPDQGRRIIVLLTDGVNNRGGDPIAASLTIGGRGIIIYTVGIGTTGSGQIIPGTNELADLDGDALQQIATNGGGQFVQAEDADSLNAAFKAIALDTVWEKKHVDASFPVAFAGGILLAFAVLIGLATGRFP